MPQHERDSFEELSIVAPMITLTVRIPTGINELFWNNFTAFSFLITNK